MKLIYSIHKYDVFMFVWLNNIAIHSTLAWFARYISKTGDGLLYIALGGWLFIGYGADDKLLQCLLLGFAFERPTYFALKNGFKRHRPQQALQNFRSLITPSDHFSFPSGHTSAACMVATLLAYFYPPLTAALYAWTAMVGFSRVILGVHFPTDTAMGALLGFATAVFSLNLLGL